MRAIIAETLGVFSRWHTQVNVCLVGRVENICIDGNNVLATESEEIISRLELAWVVVNEVESVVLEEGKVPECVIHLIIESFVEDVGDRIQNGSFSSRRPLVERENILIDFFICIILDKCNRKDGLVGTE